MRLAQARDLATSIFFVFLARLRPAGVGYYRHGPGYRPDPEAGGEWEIKQLSIVDVELQTFFFTSLCLRRKREAQQHESVGYMDKKLQIKLNANRMVVGTLRGFDQFMNLVIDNTVEVNGNEKNDIGMVVSSLHFP
nr:probable small nuclear ribonucleoprotein G [Ipomoea batatas]